MQLNQDFRRKPLDPAALEQLRARFGDRFQTGDAVRAQHGQSEAHFEPMLPDAVLFARSTSDVVDCVRICVAADVPIVPYGAGTSIEGNALPVRGGISLDLSEMNAIVAVNAEDFDCTVQAGVRREELNHHLRDQGLFFPIDPGANATIGGMASTRASGTNAVRYGTMREAVLSLTVVTPDGEVITTARRARKSAAGYDLTRLYVGSEGTLGVITEITLRLHPIPEMISSAVCGFETLKGAVDTVVQSIQLGIPLARVEILGHVGDGNFHVIFSIDPHAPEELEEVERINARLVRRALDMEGTCTGEHGIGLGKQPWLVEELGEDTVAIMRTIKRALDPRDLFNPGKIFTL